MTPTARILRLICILVLAAASPALRAHETDTTEHRPARVLGQISFPTSAKSPAAQQAFIRGMLLLHLFEYPFARDDFLEAERLEPGFAMAYWGEAMTYNAPIWDQQDLAAARAALGKLAPTPAARQAKAPTEREKAFLAAIDTLYGEGPKAERDRRYARAMEAMARRFPDDHEAQLFHALSLFGVQAGARDVPTYMQAGAIAQAVFCANPEHPGAAHYLIHAVDDPEHAALGLDAARALARMAPDAGHSLHMTSHIFTALGMWADVVNANERAVAVSNRTRAERGVPAGNWGHYNFWLLYGYLQQGRVEAARTLLEAALNDMKANGRLPEDPLDLDPDDSPLGSVIQMWARYLIETGDWADPIATAQLDPGEAFDPALNIAFVQTLRATHAGDVAAAGVPLARFRELKATLEHKIAAQAEPKPTDLLYLQRLGVLEQELLAQMEAARGDLAAAVSFAREASRLEGEMPYAFGPPFIDWPAAEMLGKLLEANGDHAGAAEAYTSQLRRARLRSASLLGLARSAQAQGNAPDVADALGKLRDNWREADPAVRAMLDRFPGSR